jgi:Protein kinase domain
MTRPTGRRPDVPADDITPEGTRREASSAANADVVGTRREGALADGYVRVNLPPELSARFEVLGEVASGGESDVLLVRRRGNDSLLSALKIYRHGLEPDLEALALIRALPREHVVEIYDCGRSSAGWWEEQEYMERGSLADLLAAEGPKLTRERLREVVLELARALEAVHPVLHRDVKPTNVFVRTGEPLDLVLGDFGLARSTAFTHIVSTVAGSLAYQSPEALDGGASPARDWWAVGMIVAEAAIGRHPFLDPELGWPSTPELRIALTTRAVPLDEIEDDRVKLLCRGMLVRDPRRRWGLAEVRAWLAGDSPAVAREHDQQPFAVREDTIQPFVFAGQRCGSPQQLAPLLAQHWQEALRLIGGGASEAPEYVRLAGWLQDHQHTPALRVLGGTHDRSLARRLFRLLRALDPQLPPSFHGYVIDREGLLDLARAAVDGNEDAGIALYDILELAILGELAREDNYADLASFEETWRQQSQLLTQLRDQLGDATAPLGDDRIAHRAVARIVQAQLDRAELSQMNDRFSELRNGLDLDEGDPRRAQLDDVVRDGTEPARLLVGLLLADHLQEVRALERANEARVRAERAAAEEAERERMAEAESAENTRRRRALVRDWIGIVSAIFGIGIVLSFPASVLGGESFLDQEGNGYSLGKALHLLLKISMITGISAAAAATVAAGYWWFTLDNPRPIPVIRSRRIARIVPSEGVFASLASTALTAGVVVAIVAFFVAGAHHSGSALPQWFWWAAPSTTAIIFIGGLAMAVGSSAWIVLVAASVALLLGIVVVPSALAATVVIGAIAAAVGGVRYWFVA